MFSHVFRLYSRQRKVQISVTSCGGSVMLYKLDIVVGGDGYFGTFI
jgi:hypothetical protein